MGALVAEVAEVGMGNTRPCPPYILPMRLMKKNSNLIKFVKKPIKSKKVAKVAEVSVVQIFYFSWNKWGRASHAVLTKNSSVSDTGQIYLVCSDTGLMHLCST